MNGYIKRSTWIAATLLGWATMALPAHAASFDCAKAATKVEKLICGNAELSKLDEELNAAYKNALQDEKKADSIRQAQKQWMKERNGCADGDCVKTAYRNRISKLEVVQSAAGAPAQARTALVMPMPRAQEQVESLSQLKMLKGKGVEVCEIFKKNLDALGSSDLRCERQVSLAYKGVIKLPEWSELDIWEKRNLMAQAGKFLDYGDSERKNTVYDNQNNVDDTAISQVKLKGISMMDASIDINNDGVDERILRYQSGICGLARYSYTTAIMVLDNTSDAVDTKKSQLLYPDIWINPKTGKKVPTRDYHYMTYGVFLLAGKTYVDRMHFDGLLEVYKLLNNSNEEVCKFKYTTK